ncbi:transmembrane protein, putative [Medicago truncatula]|uniref:Transmembrane protein, putative n=1 Tax=Medicago truncatula TaxID=3880 RepID=G7K563_MEDTR|nr:transmembrane protein, putative [Medicago truncatula]
MFSELSQNTRHTPFDFRYIREMDKKVMLIVITATLVIITHELRTVYFYLTHMSYHSSFPFQARHKRLIFIFFSDSTNIVKVIGVIKICFTYKPL